MSLLKFNDIYDEKDIAAGIKRLNELFVSIENSIKNISKSGALKDIITANKQLLEVQKQQRAESKKYEAEKAKQLKAEQDNIRKNEELLIKKNKIEQENIEKSTAEIKKAEQAAFKKAKAEEAAANKLNSEYQTQNETLKLKQKIIRDEAKDTAKLANAEKTLLELSKKETLSIKELQIQTNLLNIKRNGLVVNSKQAKQEYDKLTVAIANNNKKLLEQDKAVGSIKEMSVTISRQYSDLPE